MEQQGDKAVNPPACKKPRAKKSKKEAAGNKSPEPAVLKRSSTKVEKPSGPASKKRVCRKPPVEGKILDGLKHGMLGELTHQWKSSKDKLTAEAFPSLPTFNKCFVSPYWRRARPTVGLVAKGKFPNNGKKNKEFAHFSFPMKDVFNIGLAMHCAIKAV